MTIAKIGHSIASRNPPLRFTLRRGALAFESARLQSGKSLPVKITKPEVFTKRVSSIRGHSLAHSRAIVSISDARSPAPLGFWPRSGVTRITKSHCFVMASIVPCFFKRTYSRESLFHKPLPFDERPPPWHTLAARLRCLSLFPVARRSRGQPKASIPLWARRYAPTQHWRQSKSRPRSRARMKRSPSGETPHSVSGSWR